MGSPSSKISVGDQFGRLEVIQPSERYKYWEVRCSCGVTKEVRRDHLTTGRTLSCGCLSRENLIKRSSKHGCSQRGNQSFEYRVWVGIRKRCTNPRSNIYAHYGGRGISLSPRWEDFLAFLEDVGEAPSENHTLERINNDGDYEPGNVKWATRKEQARNRTSSRLLEFRGISKTAVEWAEQYGIPYKKFHARIQRGWAMARALEVK